MTSPAVSKRNLCLKNVAHNAQTEVAEVYTAMRYVTVTDLLGIICATRPRLVAIDGFLGAGKSTLAERIELDLGYRCVHLDNFVRAHKETFVSNLDLSRLEQRLKLNASPLVVEGVCVLAILEHFSLKSDMLIFVVGEEPRTLETSPALVSEVRRYLAEYSPETRAEYVVNMVQEHDSQNVQNVQIDIAFINAKTRLAMILASGGILAIFVGALVFVLGAKGDDSTIIKIAGLEISATGIGAVILATSAIWGYLAYLARPQYSHSRERRISTSSDGSSQTYELESRTAARVKPDNET